MAVINLGQIGDPRKGLLSGVGDFTKDLMISKKDREVRREEEAGRETRSIRQTESAEQISENALRSNLAQVKFQREKQEQDMVLTTLTNLADLPKDQRDRRLQGESGKQITKLAKRVLGPDFLGASGELNIDDFSTKNRLTNQLNQVEVTLTEKQLKGELTEDETRTLLGIKSQGAEAIADLLIVNKNFKDDIGKGMQAVESGADSLSVFRRLASVYPDKSAELKRVFLSEAGGEDFKVTGSDVKAAARQRSKFAEILRGPGAQTEAGKRLESLEQRQVSQFF